MYLIDEIRQCLHAHKATDPMAADLLQKFEAHFGFDLTSPDTTLQLEWDKMLARVKAVYDEKQAVAKQNKMIEAHRALKLFCQELRKIKSVSEDEKAVFENKAIDLMTSMASEVLGVDVRTLVGGKES